MGSTSISRDTRPWNTAAGPFFFEEAARLVIVFNGGPLQIDARVFDGLGNELLPV
jgi:fructose-1,6-bisphosphatase/inositol monophosphatase family enzyme